MLEFYEHSSVQLSARQVIRNGILLASYIGYPIVTVHVVDAKEVEAVHAERHIFEECLVLMVLVVEKLIAHTDVGTAIGWGAKLVGLQFSVGC